MCRFTTAEPWTGGGRVPQASTTVERWSVIGVGALGCDLLPLARTVMCLQVSKVYQAASRRPDRRDYAERLTEGSPRHKGYGERVG
jgi:hypothetical protein